MKHLKHLSLPVLQANFPSSGKYRNGPWRKQETIMEFVARNGATIIESPTGSGKTAVEYTILKAAQSKGAETLFLITPNKTIVEQIQKEFPDFKVALGRNEHKCFYYEEEFGADEVPCSMLRDCPHRVDQATGETYEKNIEPCPYLQQKYEAKQGGIVLCTMSFYLFTQLFTQEFGTPDVLVIDEAHRIADVVRHSLSYEITDYHLEQSIDLLKKVGIEEYKILKKFLSTMRQICKKKPPEEGILLEDEEIRKLIKALIEVDSAVLIEKIREAVRSGKISRKENRVILKKLEVLVRDIRRYINSFEYCLETERHKPLNYTCAFYKIEKGENERVQYKLVIKCYYVAALIRKILSPFTVSFSATIGDSDVFGYETGIRAPFISLDSDFPVNHTRVYLPKDTPNLAMNVRRKRDVTKALRSVARTCKRFADKGQRSLVVTISNKERAKFVMLAQEEGLDVVSYGNGLTAKKAALLFKEGQGDVLVGTAANYSEGVDLPKQIAPVIFFLRPGYPNPRDPGTVFEQRRFAGQRWALWNWRVMQQALQVRGRNIRGRGDIGVTFFISQQFRRFLFASLPEWLEKSYKGQWTLEECILDAEKLLK